MQESIQMLIRGAVWGWVIWDIDSPTLLAGGGVSKVIVIVVVIVVFTRFIPLHSKFVLESIRDEKSPRYAALYWHGQVGRFATRFASPRICCCRQRQEPRSSGMQPMVEMSSNVQGI